MAYPPTMSVECTATSDSPPLQRIDLFRGLRRLSRHFSHGYKIASVELICFNLDGRVTRDYLHDLESLVAKMFDKSLSCSICEMHHSKELPFVYVYLVENKDKSTTNIDSHFIEALSKLDFMKELAK